MTLPRTLKPTILWPLWLVALLGFAGCGQVANQSDAVQIQMAIYTPLCVEVTGASTAEGETVETFSCVTGERRQQWSFVQVAGSTSYQIININSLQCMTVSYGSPNPSTPIVQAPCYTPIPSSQVWSYVPAPAKMGYNLISAVSGLCLDIPNGETVGETQLQVYTCNPMFDPAQAFLLNPVAHGNIP